MRLKDFTNSLKRGLVREMALELGLNPAIISMMSRGSRQIPPLMAVKIEQITNGAVTRQEMRPDDWNLFWPELGGEKHVLNFKPEYKKRPNR